MIRGLYRANDPGLGEYARVDKKEGDTLFLDREMYRSLQCEPDFDTLPSRDEYASSHLYPDRLSYYTASA